MRLCTRRNSSKSRSHLTVGQVHSVSLPVIDDDLGNVANDFGEKLIGDISTAGTERG